MVNSDLVVDFINTVDLRPYSEACDSPEHLVDWLAEHGLVVPATHASGAEYDEAIRVREALRDLLAVQNGLEADIPAASAELTAAAARAKLELRFVDGASRLEPAASGVRGAVGRILAEVQIGMTDGTWARMKACRAEDCRWAFLDTAKNQTRAWCTMRSCGNRAKVRAYRERHAV